MDEGVRLNLTVTGPTKMACTQVVRAEEVARTNALDLLAWTETRAVTKLVQAVHEAGRIGTTWPTVVREPVMRNMLDEWEACDPEDAEQWFIRASVTTVPRG